MATGEQSHKHLGRQGEIAKKYVLKSQEAYATHYKELLEAAASSRSKSSALWQTYLEEVGASATGDDAMERSAAAQRNLQRGYANESSEYQRAYLESQKKAVEALAGLYSEARAESLDGLIEYLTELRQTMTSRPARAAQEAKCG